MSEDIVPIEPTMNPAEMRAIAGEYPRTLARLNRVAHTAAWAWTTLGIWIPDDDPRVAADQAKALLEAATAVEPAHAEVLWRAPGHDRPAWWRAAITASGYGAGVAWLRGEFADPTTRMIDLADVVAVLPLPPHASSSCLHAGRDDFVSSPLRPVPEPDALAPRVTMTPPEALVLTQYWLHWVAHRVGPLYPVNHEQAFDCRDRLFDLAVAAVARGPRTRIDAVAFTADLTTRCRAHVLDPLPDYVHGPDARAVGIRLIAHPHPDGCIGVEAGDLDELHAVLGIVARYGGTVRLTTTDPNLPGTAPIAESVYVVHYDLRAELVEDDRAREISALDRLVDN